MIIVISFIFFLRLLENFSCILGEDIKTSPIFSSIWSVISKNEAFVTRLCGRATATQAVLLQSLDNEHEIIVVGNTHLYFHPDADHVRLTQGGITILWLQNIVEETKKKVIFSSSGGSQLLKFC